MKILENELSEQCFDDISCDYTELHCSCGGRE